MILQEVMLNVTTPADFRFGSANKFYKTVLYKGSEAIVLIFTITLSKQVIRLTKSN